MTEKEIAPADLLAMTTDIVIAYVSNNSVPSADLPNIIAAVYDRINDLSGAPEEPAVDLVPAVPIKKSVSDEYLICLEDGKQLKMLKRHLAAAYNLTPDEYRAKWKLPHDYPMVAPGYARVRQALAKKIGLGRKPAEAPKKRTRKPRKV